TFRGKAAGLGPTLGCRNPPHLLEQVPKLLRNGRRHRARIHPMTHAPGDSPSMRAVVVRAPGGPEQLDLARVPAPELTPGTVEIEIKACALNRADLLQRRGHYPPPKGASEILGLECAGVVRSAAPDVAGIELGSRVMALLAGGGYAERAVVSAGLLMPIPKGFSFAQAAAIPEAFL